MVELGSNPEQFPANTAPTNEQGFLRPKINLSLDEATKAAALRGGEFTSLSDIEFALVKTLVGAKKPIPTGNLDDVAVDAGSYGLNSTVPPTLRRIEKKLNSKIFERSGTGPNTAWSLIEAPEEEPAAKKVDIDEEAKALKINGEPIAQLSDIELALVKPLVLSRGEPITSRVLDDLAIDAGSAGLNSAVAPTLRRVEKKAGRELFGRVGIGQKSAWFLIAEQSEQQPELVTEPQPHQDKEEKKESGEQGPSTHQEGSQLAIAQRPTREITTEELFLINRIIGFVPEDVARLWSRTGQLSPEQYQNQAIALARLIHRIEEGAETPIQASEILHAHQDQKPVVAQNVIRRTLAEMVLRSEQQPLSASKNRWGRHIRELADWLGANAKQHLISSIENLSEVERALVFEISSIALLKDLDFIDLDECDETRFAAYLRGATFVRENDLRDDTVEEMVVTAVERGSEGNLDVTKVIHLLLQLEYSEFLFQRIFESGKFRKFRDELMAFFAHHPATRQWAIKTEESLFSDYADEELPTRRIKE